MTVENERPTPELMGWLKDADQPWHARLTLALTILTLLVTTVIFDLSIVQTVFAADVRALLPFAQVVGAVFIYVLARLPRSRREWLVVVVLHVVMRLNVEALQRDMHKWIMLWGVQLFQRVFILTAWLMLALAAFTLLVTIVKKTARWHRWAPNVLKMGFATAIVLIPLEIVALRVEQQRYASLPVPSNLSKTDAIHIATIGGSTMLGYPYQPHYGIGRVVEWELQQSFPDKTIRLDNVAVTGINLDLAVGRLAAAKAFPDIVIIYSGHNEFFHDMEELGLSRRADWPAVDGLLRKSPLFRVMHVEAAKQSFELSSLRNRADLCSTRLCPEYLVLQRQQRYQDKLKQLFEWAQKHDVDVVFCVPAASEKDLEPNLSVPSGSLVQAEDRIATLWQEIRDLQAQRQWSEAAERCRTGLSEHPDFAEFHFRLAECLLVQGDSILAREHFQRAIDLDQMPMRCWSRFCQAGIAVAEEYHVPVINSADLWRPHTADNILGAETFLDGVHPNLRATFRLAREVTHVIEREKFAGLSNPVTIAPTFAQSLADLGVTTEVLAESYETVAKVLERYAQFRTYDNIRRLREAAEWHVRAAALRSGELQPGGGGTESLTP